MQSGQIIPKPEVLRHFLGETLCVGDDPPRIWAPIPDKW